MFALNKNAVNTLQYIKDSLESWDKDLPSRERHFALEQDE